MSVWAGCAAAAPLIRGGGGRGTGDALSACAERCSSMIRHLVPFPNVFVIFDFIGWGGLNLWNYDLLDAELAE